MEPEILVVGTGPGPVSLLTREAEGELLAAEKVFFRMSAHPVYRWLEERGKLLVCFDRIYMTPKLTYPQVYEFIVEALIKEATVRGRAVYALPGNPWVFESTTGWLQRDAPAKGIAVRVVPGMSFLELVYAELALDPAAGVQIVTPGALEPSSAAVGEHLALLIGLIGQTLVPDPRCGETNVEALHGWLLERYPREHPVSLVWTTGMPDYRTQARTFPLSRLPAECASCDFFASLYVPPLERNAAGFAGQRGDRALTPREHGGVDQGQDVRESTSALTTGMVLRRLSPLDLRLEGDRVLIDLDGRQVAWGRHALAVLDQFSRPRMLSEALAALESRVTGAEDWKDLTTTVVGLFDAGVLRDATHPQHPGSRRLDPYGVAPVHIRMLDDRARTGGFLAAIRERVRPGDVVVDLGTGTGVLAVAAAQAGARRVYAIEESGIAAAARSLFEANGCADRVTLVEGGSTAIDLPERADVLVSEMIGNDPLGERILSLTADAVKRLVKPEARLIPSRIRVCGLPVTVPREVLGQQVFEQAPLQRWRSWYGIDFGSLAGAGTSRPQGFLVDPHQARDWPALADAVVFLDADLRTARSADIRRTCPATAGADGTLNGILEYFEAELAPGVRLSTHPAGVEPGNHWHSRVWILAQALPLAVGERFTVAYTRKAPASPGEVHVARARGVERSEESR